MLILTSRVPWHRRPSGLVVPNTASPLWSGLKVWWPLDRPAILGTITTNGQALAVDGSTIQSKVAYYNGSVFTAGTRVIANNTPQTISMWARHPGALGLTTMMCVNDTNLPVLSVWWWGSGGNGLLVQSALDATTSRAAEMASSVDHTQWHLYTVTWDGSTNRPVIYVDGRQNSQNGSAGLNATGDGIFIGIEGVGSYAATQYACDFRQWSRVLSPTEIWALYDPRTRWELYAPQVRRIYVDVPAGGGGPTYTLACDPGSYTLTGTDATLTVSRTIACDPGGYSLTGTDAALTVGRTLTCDPGAYTVTGTDATLTVARVIDAGSGSYTLTGTDAALTVSRVLACDPGSYTLTGTDADLVYSPAGGPTYTLVADPGSYTITGTDAALTVARTLACDPGAYTLTGTDAALLRGYTLEADPGVYTLTGTDAALIASRVLDAESGAYVLTGTAATLTYSGAAPDLAADSDTWRARARPTAWRARPRPTDWRAKG